MNPIKESFQRVKIDISLIYKEITLLKKSLEEVKKEVFLLKNTIQTPISQSKEPSTQYNINLTHPTHFPTHPLLDKAGKSQILGISTGNEGVPTDRQTDRQTDTKTNFDKEIQIEDSGHLKTDLHKDPIEDAISILNSLDNIKKEIRRKFKNLTNQEMLIFSVLYKLEEEGNNTITYETLSKQTGLTESSIRDYVGRLIKKGIPINKKKINNKTIMLSISPNLKKIATLSTILKLREI